MRFSTAGAQALEREEPRADMTPMIDVVFQILIFFLCTLHFRQLEGRLDVFLPKGAGSGPGLSSLCPLELGIHVLVPGERRDPRHPELSWNGSGPFELVGRRLSYVLGPRKTSNLEALRTRLEELRARDPAYRLSLFAGPGTLQGDVLRVLDLALDAGFREVLVSGAR